MLKVEVRRIDEGIAISFPYDPKLVAKVKSIQGSRWHQSVKGPPSGGGGGLKAWAEVFI